MKYYKVKYDLNPKVVGSDNPQSWQFTKEYEKRKNNPNAVYALAECMQNYKIPDFIPDLDGFVLSGRAKQTNFIHIVTHRTLFMDEYAKKVLQSKCNLGEHEFYEATLYVRKEPNKYYCLGVFYDIKSVIEYNKCNYVIYGIKDEQDLPEEWFTKPINSFSDIYNIRQRYRDYPAFVNILCQNLVLKRTFDKTIDFFDILLPGEGGYGICTERFKNAVEEAGLTGLVFEPIDVIIEE